MTFWKNKEPLVLASTSTTRQQLLRATEIPFIAIAPDVDEREVETRLNARGASAREIALELAKEKALAVGRRFPGRCIVAADQTLAIGASLLHKPTDTLKAGEQLMMLSGKTHHLHSAVVCAKGSEILFSDVSSAALTMRPLTSSFLGLYLRSAGEAVTRSVGGYQIEGQGIHLFEKIEGDHSTILGLPLLPLLAFLRDAGLVES